MLAYSTFTKFVAYSVQIYFEDADKLINNI